MEEIVKVFAWPIAVVILGLLFMIIFRGAISSLLKRITQVGKEGLKATPSDEGGASVEQKPVSEVPIMVRDQLGELVGTVEQCLKNARNEVRISGNDCKYAVESASGWIEAALARGVSVKVICVDPKSTAPDMLTKIDPRFPTAEAFADSMESVEKVLRWLKKGFPTRFEFRYIPILPAMGFFMMDPTPSSGIIKVEFYVSQPFKPLDSRPHILLPEQLVEWREYFLAQWDNYWQLAREPSSEAEDEA